MSTTEIDFVYSWVDSEDKVKDFIDAITALPQESPLFFDIEGANLSRGGTILIIQILVVCPEVHCYLLDVWQLKDVTFTTIGSNGTTVRLILESPDISLVFFDCSNDQAALFGEYSIEVGGAIDLQIWQRITREQNDEDKNYYGLARCIENDAALPEDMLARWKEAKEGGKLEFDFTKGGTTDIFKERPLPPIVLRYVLGDVLYMPNLLHVYGDRLKTMGPAAKQEVVIATLLRLKNSQRVNTRSRNRKGATIVRTGLAIEAREYYEGVELPPRAIRHSIVTLKFCAHMDYKGIANIFKLDEDVVKMTYELALRYARGEKALYDVMDASQSLSQQPEARGRSLPAFLEGARNGRGRSDDPVRQRKI